MSRCRWGLALLGSLGLALAACSTSSSSSLDLAKARAAITKLASNAYSSEAKVGAVKCPQQDVPMKKGLTFACSVEIDGIPLRLTLRQTDNRGHVHIDQSQALLFTKKLESFVGGYANDHGHPVRTVACSSAPVIARTPGDKVSCSITYADGSSGTARVAVRDTSGRVALLSISP